ncbi:MAG: response regulator [Pseudomonadota bacterium]
MKILIVDDEKKIADLLAERLSIRGFAALPVYDGLSALDLLATGDFDGMVLDLRLPDIDGIEILRRVSKNLTDMRVVILSGHGNEKDFKTCIELGAIACFNKPANIAHLIDALRIRDKE